MNRMLATGLFLLSLAWLVPATAEEKAREAGPQRHAPLAAVFDRADMDKDDKVSYDDLKSVLPRMPKERFDSLDKDKSGALTREELPIAPAGGAGMRLREADKNGDHKITPEEYKAAFPNAPADSFKQHDSNNDGALDQNDMRREGGPRRAAPAAFLRKADKNGDQKVTEEEFKAALPNAPAERFKAWDRNADGALDQSDMAAGPVTAEGAAAVESPKNWVAVREEMLVKADKDGDKKVSLAELQAEKPGFPEDAFKKLDANNDGALSTEDAAPNVRKEGFGERLKKADADSDGKVTFEEAQAATPDLTRERFEKMDRNGDGSLTLEDRKGKK
ncbi:MAG: EF-hand domain-containing protein [Candidatus Hydrogenedentes bacterium]|nr:EF-hand domain-containing protein [Candidatus Hydrogenedentota bacterium]